MSFLIVVIIASAVLLPSSVLYTAFVHKSLKGKNKVAAAARIWLFSMTLIAIAWVFINMLALGPLFCRDFNDSRGYCPSSDNANSFVWTAYKYIAPIASGVATGYFIKFGIPKYRDRKTDLP
ncbi:hypothetical protein [Leptolyngbya sp. BC1307]|uniref:hypothetical protein n=1 Tax=Leptolyngbya sp. BC1307 TaxID=2029589 RepID=UPI000EFA3223|nr:hypothetical protein [Leptolyngbya sp. BC1307]